MSMYCHNCGAYNSVPGKKCVKCGQKLKSKFRFPKRLFIITLECVAIAAIGYWIYNIGSSCYKPKNVAGQYFVRLVNGDYDEAYEMLELPESQYLTKDAFRKTAIANAFGDVTSYSVSSQKPKKMEITDEYLSPDDIGNEPMNSPNTTYSDSPGDPTYSDFPKADFGPTSDGNNSVESYPGENSTPDGASAGGNSETPTDNGMSGAEPDGSEGNGTSPDMNNNSGMPMDNGQQVPPEPAPEKAPDASVTFQFSDSDAISSNTETESVTEGTDSAEPREKVNIPETDLGQTYYVKYRLKGNDYDCYYEINLSKNQSKQYYVFDKWVIASASLWSSDIKILVPKGTKVEVDGFKIAQEFTESITVSGAEPQDVYVIPYLFNGTHKIKVSGDGYETFEDTFQASEGYNLDHMNYSAGEVKSLQSIAISNLKQIYSCAAGNVDFQAITDIFTYVSDDRNKIAEEYSKLVEFFDTENLVGFDIKDVKAENKTDSSSVVLTIQGTVRYLPNGSGSSGSNMDSMNNNSMNNTDAPSPDPNGNPTDSGSGVQTQASPDVTTNNDMNNSDGNSNSSSREEKTYDTTLQLAFNFVKENNKWVQTNLGCTSFYYE